MSNSLPNKNGCQAGSSICPAVQVPRIMLPAPSVDLYTWAVIACDQHTAQPAYWHETARLVQNSPSTLHLVLPEYLLEHPDGLPLDQRIARINQNMQDYLAEGLFQKKEPGCILLQRHLSSGKSRLGLLLAIDLECYDFQPGNKNLVRATEGTVLDRIPPRVKIRRHAPMELPHVQVLIDDPGRTVIEPLFENCLKNTRPVNETDLMQGGGAVRGWFCPDGSAGLDTALAAMAGLATLKEHGLLMAVGDGNHSLATAKTHWDKIKKDLPPDHPARFALVEMINLHDDALVFEPIHRTLAGLGLTRFKELAGKWFAGQGGSFAKPGQASPAEAMAFPLICGTSRESLVLTRPEGSLAAAILQPFLDWLVKDHQARIDYIHGQAELERLAGLGQIGLFLPSLDKHDLFPHIAQEGVFPRKTFSMGEAEDKRYYLESRLIR